MSYGATDNDTNGDELIRFVTSRVHFLTCYKVTKMHASSDNGTSLVQDCLMLDDRGSRPAFGLQASSRMGIAKVEWPERESDHYPLSSAGAKHACTHTSHLIGTVLSRVGKSFFIIGYEAVIGDPSSKRMFVLATLA
jgi:hypothetical protein